MSLSNRIKIAKATKTFGLNGELVLRLYDDFPEEMNEKEPIFAELSGLTVPFFFSSFERRGNSRAVAVFDDIDTEYRAKELVGAEFFVEAGEFSDDGKIYYEDLAGYRFRDETSGREGTITGFIDHDSNPLLEAEAEGRTVYIPANDDFVGEIDPEKEEIRFRLPEGLLELYL